MSLTIRTRHANGETIKPKLTHVDCELSIVDVSRLMRNCGAEELLVTDQAEGALVPIGIVTARDIVTRIVAAGLDPAVLTAGDITWSASADSDTKDSAALQALQESDNDVLAIMHGDGRLAAIVTLHDLMKALSRSPSAS